MKNNSENKLNNEVKNELNVSERLSNFEISHNIK